MAVSGSQFAWWLLSRKQKESLEQARREGRFGGETAKGVGKAPYFWAQEYGEQKAGISAKGYVGEAFGRFRARAGSIVSAYLRTG